MIVLALDTSTVLAGLALYDAAADRSLYALSWLSQRQQTRELAGYVRTALEACALSPAKVGMVAVATGPGSFTGVRIGLSVAKGMVLGACTDMVLVGIPTMSIMLAPLYYQVQALGYSGLLLTVLPAGRDRFIWTTMSSESPDYYPTSADHCLGTVAELARFLERDWEDGGHIWMGGEYPSDVHTTVQHFSHVVRLPQSVPVRSPAVLAQLAWERWQTDPGCTDPAHLVPLYVSSQ